MIRPVCQQVSRFRSKRTYRTNLFTDSAIQAFFLLQADGSLLKRQCSGRTFFNAGSAADADGGIDKNFLSTADFQIKFLSAPACTETAVRAAVNPDEDLFFGISLLQLLRQRAGIDAARRANRVSLTDRTAHSMLGQFSSAPSFTASSPQAWTISRSAAILSAGSWTSPIGYSLPSPVYLSLPSR